MKKSIIAFIVAASFTSAAHATLLDLDIDLFGHTTVQNSKDVKDLQGVTQQHTQQIGQLQTGLQNTNNKLNDTAIKAGQAFDIAVEGRATAGNALDTANMANNKANQLRSDLTAETTARVNGDKANATAIANVNAKVDGYATQGAAAYTELSGKINGVDGKVNDLAAAGQAAYNDLNGKVGAVDSKVDSLAQQGAQVAGQLNDKIDAGDAALNDRVSNLAAQTAADTKALTNGVAVAQATGTAGVVLGTVANLKVDALGATVAANTKAQAGVNKSVDGRLTMVEGKTAQNSKDITGLKTGLANTNTKVDSAIAAQTAVNGQVQQQFGETGERIGKTETRLDTVEGNVRDTNAHLDVVDTRSQNNAVRLDGAESAIRETNDQLTADRTNINNRVDGVQSQVDRNTNDIVNVGNVANDAYNKAANAQATANTAVGIGQKNSNDIVNLDNRTTSNTQQIQKTQNDLVNTNNTLTQNVKQTQSNTNRITVAEGTIATHTTQLANHETRITTNESNIAKNTSDIKSTQTVVKNQGKVINNHETRITNNETNISNLSNDYYQFQDIYNTNNQIINNNINSSSARTLQQSKSYTDQQVGGLRSEMNRNRSDDQKEYRSGIASVAAMANIPVVPGQVMTVGAGIGTFKDRTALAVGVGANIRPNVQVKASVGFSNDSDAVAGAGIGFGF